MKVLVTGASGLLGRAVASTFTLAGHQVVGLSFTRSGPDLRQVDLRDESALSSVLKEISPDVIVHCAAERRPDIVEGAPEEAHAINVEVPGILARLCSELDGSGGPPLLINISTDYVFDGVTPPHRVEDSPNPLNAYGMSKWNGEKAVAQHGADGRVASLRVPVLYGKAEKPSESAVNVLLTAIEPPAPGAPHRKMDASAVRYPTSVDDVARCLLQVATIWSSSEGAKPVPPLLHFSAREPMTKHDMCNVLARIQRSVGEQAETEHLDPVFEPDASEATKRPRHVKLDMAVTQEYGVDTTCTGFEDWWTPYLEELAVKAREERRKKAEEEEKRRKEEEERKRKEEEERLKREEEEARKRAEEAAERKRIEEEERRKREEEERQRREKEEAERRRQEEEEEQKRKVAEEEEAQRKLAEEELKKNEGDATDAPPLEDAGAIATAAAAVEGASSLADKPLPDSAPSTGSARAVSPTDVASPSSPHLSFSSLQARPTPPATSGIPSPTASIPPTQLPDSVDAEQREPSPDEETVGSTSHIRAADGEEGGGPADPLAAAAAAALAPANAKASQSTASRFLEEPGFFPAALTASGDGFSATGSGSGVQGAAHAGSGDADSDGYGQPSPRASTAPAQFEAGYGEVPFGLDDEGGSQPHSTAPGSEAMSRDASTSAQGREAGTATETAQKADGKPPRPWFIIKVGDPQKVGDPVTAHIVYTVRTRTNSPNFRGESISVLRRYSDFRWLHAALVHSRPGVFIPPVPEKVKVGRFAPDLVEARRHGLENCINKIANHALLQDDEDLKLFLESDRFAADVKARDAIKGPVPTPEQKTYFGWSTSIGAPKFHEFDDWFDQQKAYLDSLEFQLKQLVRGVSAVAQLRKDYAGQTAELSQALLMLSGSSLSRSLSTCFAGLGEVERRTCELGDLQADADVRDLGSVVYEYERIVGSIRKAFMARGDVWLAWQRADDEARKVRAKHEKLKRESRVASSDRLHDSLQDVAESEGRALALKQDFDLVGARCKEEMARFDHEKVEDLRKAIGDWLQGLIERQAELVGEWKQYAALIERQTKLPVRGKPTS